MDVILAPGYERALGAALDFLIQDDALQPAQQLLDRALVFLPKLLAEFPRAGRVFSIAEPASARVYSTIEKIHALLGTDIELREYMLDDYLVLYAIHGQDVRLLTLRHHRQSGFGWPR